MAHWVQSCWAQVDDDGDELVDGRQQRGQKRRFWQFNDSRPEPEPLIQPARKQKASKRKASLSAQQPKEVDMSANSLSGSARPESAQLTAEQGIDATEEQTEGLFTTPDGWTVINDSLTDGASSGSEEDILPGSASLEEVSLLAQEAGSSTGVKHSNGSERSEAMPRAFNFAEEQLPEASAAASFKASGRVQAAAKQKGMEHTQSPDTSNLASAPTRGGLHKLHATLSKYQNTKLILCLLQAGFPSASCVAFLQEVC